MKELVLIINSGRCCWGKCIFCGWGKTEKRRKSLSELKQFLDERLKRVKDVECLKIFNSGSFFDKNQIPEAFRSYVVKKCEQLGIKDLVVESLPHFITKENLKNMESKKVRVHVAVGLEVADDKILRKLGKSIVTKKNYIKASEILHQNDFLLRTYLIANPPFVKDIKKSLKMSVQFAKKYSDSIAVCNLYPHSNSTLFDLWVKRKWRPLDRYEFNKITKGLGVETFFDNFVFIPRWLKEKQVKIVGVGIKQLKHPYFDVWQDYICRFYQKPKEKDVALFVPCSYRKPYWSSKLHRAIRGVLDAIKIKNRIHVIVISSPGVIPIELCNNYPFNSYDWPEWKETKKIKKEYIKITRRRIENYLKHHKYKRYFCYFKPTSESYIALKMACRKLKIKLVSCSDERIYKKVKNEVNPLTLPEMLDILYNKLSVLKV